MTAALSSVLALGWSAPWLLSALVLLPALWWLLRAVPPRPIRQRFPAVALLLGLEDEHQEADKTPWWLMVLRLLAVAALIIGFAGPVHDPNPEKGGRGPVLFFVDGWWAGAPDWSQRMALLDEELAKVEADGRPAAVVLSPQAGQTLKPETGAPLQDAGTQRAQLAGLGPVAWDGSYEAARDWAQALQDTTAPPQEVVWLSDGLARDGRMELLNVFEGLGGVRVLQSPTARLALAAPEIADGQISLTAHRAPAGGEVTHILQGIGPDPAGVERVLIETPVLFSTDAAEAEATLEAPAEIRNRVTRFVLRDTPSAGAVVLVDDGLRRRRVGLMAGRDAEGLALLSQQHYLRQALADTVELIEADTIPALIRASVQFIILPDLPGLSQPDAKALTDWVQEGGHLLRFAGPRMAAFGAGAVQGGAVGAGDGVAGPDGVDPLLPVRLRAGGRITGGAMSWASPRRIAPFEEASPFFGLPVPDDIRVEAQVLAEPGPDLAARTIARLEDGTPLVTRKPLGAGQVVLFHISANAEWSSLSLSGLFVQMLERLAVVSARAQDQAGTKAEGQADVQWKLSQTLGAFGVLEAPSQPRLIAGEVLARGVGPQAPPGLYTHEGRQRALNVLPPGQGIAPANWPARIAPQWTTDRVRVQIGPWFLAMALVLGALDVIAALVLSGRLSRARAPRTLAVLGAGAMLCATVFSVTPNPLLAQDTAAPAPQVSPDQITIAATVSFAFIPTGNPDDDTIVAAGLTGLSDALYARSSVEPATPVAVNPEADALSLFPLIYWVIRPDTARPSPEAYLRLRAYLAAGGLIIFDTRDGALDQGSAATRRLREIALPLSLPALEPVPHDHVLTRAFYLLDQFPGRYQGPVWAEAANDAGRAREDGVPFRPLNDGVTPVLLTGNDWVGAWAVREDGRPYLPVGRGFAGERQREIATRFGVNLVMHVLTGNYKSDQVHVPALLQRLGE